MEKKIKKRYTCLRKLGITHRDAYVTANSRRGYYHISHTRVLEKAISKERLNKRGLVNSLDHYLKVHIIYKLNRRIPNGMYGGVKGYHISKRSLLKIYSIRFIRNLLLKMQIENLTINVEV